MIEIYYGKTNTNELEKKEAELVDFFKERINKFTNVEEKNIRINLYYYLQKKLQEKNISLSFTLNSFGKIYLNDSLTYISLTHSKGYYAFAISNEEIGLDMEKIRNNINERIINRISKEKIKKDEIIKIWTIKESYLKYLGIGITLDLKNIVCDEENASLNSLMVAKYQNFNIEEMYELTICSKNKQEVIIKKISC